MNEDQLERLLQAARDARTPVQGSSVWLEDRVMRALQAERESSTGWFDGALIFRMLLGAAAITVIALLLPLAQGNDAYAETIELNNSAAQLEKIP